MTSLLKSLALVVVGSGLISTGFAAQKVYTPPVIPPGANPATIAADREDWLQQVQQNFDRTAGKQFDLVFDGDSIIAGWVRQGRGLNVWNAHYAKAVNFGLPGDLSQNVLWRLQPGQMDGINPKVVVLMIGAGNLLFDAPEQIAAGIKAVLDEYGKDAPGAKIILMGLLPRGATAADPVRAKVTQVNQLIAPLADGQRVIYLDIGDKFLQPDGSLNAGLYLPNLPEPNAQGYQVWVDALQPQLSKLLP